MNCKHCNAELEEGVTLCPVCGEEQDMAEETPAETAAEVVEEAAVAEEAAPAEEAAETAEPEKKELPFVTDYEKPAQTEIKEGVKATPGKIALAVVAGVVVLAILVALVISGIGRAADSEEPTIAPTAGVVEETVDETIPSNGDPASPLCKASYTVSDEDAAAAADTVVATMGDRVLTNGELQAYYWQEIYLFLQEYGSYADYIGLNLYAPLDEQLTEAGEVPMSWQQFFLDSAIYTWKNYQSMALEAEAAGYELPAERQAELDSLPADLEANAKTGGFEDADALVKYNVGAGCSLEDYLSYVQLYYYGQSYYYDYCEALDPTAEEVEAFFAENEDYYAQNGITKDTKYVDVRHVLLQPEGGETGEDGYPVFTDEAWEACRVKAEALYEQWQTGDLSEDSFAQLAMDNSEDGNASTGGLYENVYVGQMVEEFENWCFDEARKVGDHGLVKTSYGYHIMFFSGSRDAWYANAEYDLISELAYDMIPEMIEKYPSTVDYSAIVLSAVSLY